MRLLVLGGTRFLGRHLGDRNADLSALDGRRFDAVVDTSACWPRRSAGRSSPRRAARSSAPAVRRNPVAADAVPAYSAAIEYPSAVPSPP